MSTARASWLLAALIFVSVTVCTPTEPISKRQSGSGIVTGIDSRDQNGRRTYCFRYLELTHVTGNPFLRLEVRDMRTNYPDQWNLYLLGLDQLHVTSQEEPESYYGLAGELPPDCSLCRN